MCCQENKVVYIIKREKMQKQIHSIYMKEEIIVCVFVIAFSMCCVTNCSQSSQDTVPLLKKLNVSLMPFITLNLSVVSLFFIF